MISIIFTIVILLLLTAFYKLYYKPKKSLKWYYDVLTGLGYKVKLLNFQFMGCPPITGMFKDSQTHLDGLYSYKHEYATYDVMLFNTFHSPTIELLSPELIKQFFQPDNVYVHYKLKLLIQNLQRTFGNGIAFSEGKEWKRKRIIMNAVFNYEFIIENIPKIIRICQQGMQLMEKQCQQAGKMETIDGEITYKVDILELFAGVFSNVMLECFFGSASTYQKINGQSVANFINKLNNDITLQNFELPILIFGTKFAELGLRKLDRDINQQIRLLRELATRLIKKRLSELDVSGPREKYQDIIEALVLKKSFDKNQGVLKNKSIKIKKEDADNYDFEELIEEFCTFFTAGTDTTSHFMQMMVYYISQHKHVEERLRKDIEEIIKSDDDINKQNLKNLVYIDWIQNETTRYYGPGNGIFTRTAIKDHYIGNIPIKQGTTLNIQPTSPHFNEKYYKNPHEFRPERWESECNGNHPFAFGGFGGGPRSCIGKHLAMLESKITLIKFVKRYKSFTLPKQNYRMHVKFLSEAEPMDMTLIK